MNNKARLTGLLLICIITTGSGCSRLVRHYTRPLFNDLTLALMQQKDPLMAEQGTPAFLLLLDGLITNNPQDKELLLAGAKAYSAYNTAFVGDRDKERSKLIALKAKDYGFRAFQLHRHDFDSVRDKPFAEFAPFVAKLKRPDVPYIFYLASTWLGWIQANSDSWDAVAELSKVQTLFQRVLDLDETFYFGTAHTMMGALLTVNPPSLGGKPEEARIHFERAIELSNGAFLPVFVLYAERYAKLVYNEQLYFALLQRALDAQTDAVAELTLMNILAQQQARTLMETTRQEEYFD